MKTSCAAALLAIVSTCAIADPDPIVAWGDSLTAGTSVLTTAQTYPAQLSQLLGGRTVVNRGIGGQTSREIAARQGGAPALLGFVGNLIPPTGNVTTNFVSVFPISWQGPAQLWGTIQGVHGVVTLGEGPMGNPQLVFRRDKTFANAPVVLSGHTPLLPDTGGMEKWPSVFWLGRNNFPDTEQVVTDTGHCVQTLKTTHYVVLSVLTGANEAAGGWTHGKVMTLNGRLAETFPGHYLDVRAALIDSYDPKQPQDVADYAMNTVPASLRADVIHLNGKGNAIVAAKVAAFLQENAW